MNKKSQQGLTTIGWLLVIGIFGMVTVTGFKILPMYLDFLSVKNVMETVSTDPEIDPKSKRDLWGAISKRLQINSIRNMTKEDFSFTRKDGKTTITADYEVRKPYVAQLFIGAHFVHSIEIDR